MIEENLEVVAEIFVLATLMISTLQE